MVTKSQPVSFVVFTILFFVGLIGGCKSPAELVDEADEDAYAIIGEKWDPSFGQMANYKIRDSVATYEEISEMIPSSGVITLQNAVEIATKYSRAYQSQKESLYTSALSLTSTRHQYERQLFGTFDAQYTDPDGSDSGKLSSSGGIDKAFVTAGGVLANIGLSVNWSRFLTDDPYTTLGSILNASITAPLLGNVAGIQAWENLTQSERNMLYQVRNFNRYRQTFVVSIINEYYRVLQAAERLKIARDSYQRQLRTVERTQMEVDVKQRAQADADRIRQDLLNAENSIISNEQSYKQTLDSFKVTLSLPADADITLDPNELLALEELGVSEPEYTLDEAIDMSLNLRLDLANTKDRLDDDRRALVLAEKGLGVQMDISVSANVTTPSNEKNIGELRFDRGTYTASTGVDLPFDQISERNNYRRALITMQQSLRSYDEELERVKLDVRQAYRNLVESTQSYEIQKISVKLAERRVDEQKIRLELGSATIIDLQDSEDALVSAQNNFTNAIINYLNAKLSFYRDIGVLEVKPDGMWEQNK